MDCINIGKTIYLLRKKAGLTQSSLGAKIHVSDKTISKWENGYGLPDISILTKLAQTLGISVDALLSKTDLDLIADEHITPLEKESNSNEDINKTEPLNEGVKNLTINDNKKEEEILPNDRYRLNLYQVTHNTYTTLLVLCYVAIILLWSTFGAFSKTIYSDYFHNKVQIVSPSIMGVYNTEYSIHVSDNPLSLMSIITTLAMFFVAVLSLIQLIKIVNGNSLYSIKLPAIIFGLCIASLVYSIATLPYLNYMEGRNVYLLTYGLTDN